VWDGLPSSWGAFSALQHLTLSGTQLQCSLTVDADGEVSGGGGAYIGSGPVALECAQHRCFSRSSLCALSLTVCFCSFVLQLLN